MTFYVLYFLLFIGCLKPFSDAFGPEKELVQELLQTYGTFPKSGRPLEDPSQPLQVLILLSLHQIVHINQESEYLDCVGTTIMDWQDPLLVWNSSSHHNVSQVRINADLIWTPDIILVNGIEPMTALHPEYALVHNDGNIHFKTRRRFRTSCPAIPGNTTQTCNLIFRSSTQNGHYLTLKESHDRMEVTHFVRNNDWELITAKAETKSPDNIFPEVVFTISTKARPKTDKNEAKVQDSHANHFLLDTSLFLFSNLVILLHSFL